MRGTEEMKKEGIDRGGDSVHIHAEKKITGSNYINRMQHPPSVPSRHRDKNMTTGAGGGHTMPLYCISDTALLKNNRPSSWQGLSLIFA